MNRDNEDNDAVALLIGCILLLTDDVRSHVERYVRTLFPTKLDSRSKADNISPPPGLDLSISNLAGASTIMTVDSS
jgi:hypothetical protein